VSAPPVPVMPEPTPTPAVAAEAAPIGSLDAAAVRRVWDEVLTVVRRRKQRAWAVVREATVRDVHGDEIVLMFQHGVHANMFDAQAALLVEALTEVLGGTWRVRAELGGDQTQRAAPASDPPAAAAPEPSQPPEAPTTDGDWPTPATPGGAGAPAAEPPPPPADPPQPARRARPAPQRGARSRPEAAKPQEGPAVYDGFDPGDEPLDDAVDPSRARQTSEEQAIQLLTEHFGAEPIGGSEPRL
jgi:DNA polymerase-3 subunit gamma/tau